MASCLRCNCGGAHPALCHVALLFSGGGHRGLELYDFVFQKETFNTLILEKYQTGNFYQIFKFLALHHFVDFCTNNSFIVATSTFQKPGMGDLYLIYHDVKHLAKNQKKIGKAR